MDVFRFLNKIFVDQTDEALYNLPIYKLLFLYDLAKKKQKYCQRAIFSFQQIIMGKSQKVKL